MIATSIKQHAVGAIDEDTICVSIGVIFAGRLELGERVCGVFPTVVGVFVGYNVGVDVGKYVGGVGEGAAVIVGDVDRDGEAEGGVMDGATEGGRLMLGDRDADGIWLIDGTADGDGTNGRENLVMSSDSNSPPSTINAPFDVVTL